MKTEQKLAKAFKTLADQGEQIDSTASTVLAIVKGAGAVSEDKFDELVAAAYEANGWNTEVGRPKNGAKPKAAAPNTVRTYVTIMRRAIRVGLRIGRYDTFTALRTSLERKSQPRLVRQNAKRAVPAQSTVRIPRDLAPNFVGIEITQPRDPNGALFHDLAATWISLKKEDDRAEMGREIAALMHKWLPKAGVPVIGRIARRNDPAERKVA